MKGQKDEIETAKREKEDCIQTNSNVSLPLFSFLKSDSTAKNSLIECSAVLAVCFCVMFYFALFLSRPLSISIFGIVRNKEQEAQHVVNLRKHNPRHPRKEPKKKTQDPKHKRQGDVCQTRGCTQLARRSLTLLNSAF